MEQYELPDGWVWTTLGEICEVNPGLGWPDYVTEETPISFVPMAAVDDISGRIVASEPRPIKEVWKGYTRFVEGDVIFARITPCMENGKAAIATSLVNGIGTGSTEFHVLRPTEAVLAEWVYRFVRQQSFRDEASRAMTGTAGQLRVPRAFMEAASIPLAPIAEQERVVSRIEALFEQSRTAREALDAIPALLRRFRQAVLAAAFRGELSTRDPNDEPASALLERILEERRRRWEENLRAKGKDPRRYTYPEPVPPDTRGLPELPEGWCWATVEQLGAIDEQAVLTGPFGSNLSRDDFVDTGVPVLTIGCLTEQGIMLDKAFYVSEEKAVELARYRVQQNDILFSRMASVGRADMVPGDIEGSIINYHLMRLRLHRSAIDPKFFVFYVRGSTNVTDYLRKINHGITRDGINTQQLLKLPVALAPKAEQRAIVSRVQSLFAQADIVEVAAELARRRLDRLDQSILARAFRGELVPQDPNDEPASVLLERIRAEKARRAGERTSRRRNKGRK